MSERSAIEWTDATWNPWHGCHKVSEGCKHCYMFREKRQYGQDPDVVVRSKTKFYDPAKWKDGRRVFTCSWSDWFIEEADPWRDEAWDVIRRTPQHTYQIVTKRLERAADHLPPDWPFENVWLLVSVENQRTADARIPQLLATRARVRGVSYEPALGPVDFSNIHRRGALKNVTPGVDLPYDIAIDALTGRANDGEDVCGNGTRLDWVIVGGESGPGARPPHPEWIRSARDQCASAGVAFFFKQWGEYAPVPKQPTGYGHLVRAGDVIVAPDGRRAPIEPDFSCTLEGGGYPMRRVGKKEAGAVLDGREWREFPGAAT